MRDTMLKIGIVFVIVSLLVVTLEKIPVVARNLTIIPRVSNVFRLVLGFSVLMVSFGLVSNPMFAVGITFIILIILRIGGVI